MDPIDALAAARPRRAITDAAIPFNKPSADVILRSVDLVDFWVKSAVLVEASPAFEQMLEPLGTSRGLLAEDVKAGLPIIPVSEDSATLDQLLRLCYPVNTPALSTFEDLRVVMRAADKYMMDAATRYLRRRLLKFGKHWPLPAFAIACSMHLEDEVSRLAPLASTVAHMFVRELAYISAGVYHRLCHLPFSHEPDDDSLSPSPATLSWFSTPTKVPDVNESRGRISYAYHMMGRGSSDVVIYAGDEGTIRGLSSAVLSSASPVLKKKLQELKDARVQSSGPSTPSVLTLELTETAPTLFEIVGLCYSPSKDRYTFHCDFTLFKSVLAAAHKYEISAAYPILRESLARCASTDPLPVFALTISHNYMPERRSAARAALQVSYDELVEQYVPELETIPATDYFHLLSFHLQAGEQVSRCILQNAIIHHEAVFGPWPWRRSLDASWLRERIISPMKAFRAQVLARPRQLLSAFHTLTLNLSRAIEQDVLDARHSLLRSFYRRIRCRCLNTVREGDIDPQWRHFYRHETPCWWLAYVYELGMSARERPVADPRWEKTLHRTAVSEAVKCRYCRTRYLPAFRDFTADLAAFVGDTVDKELDIFSNTVPLPGTSLCHKPAAIPALPKLQSWVDKHINSLIVTIQVVLVLELLYLALALLCWLAHAFPPPPHLTLRFPK